MDPPQKKHQELPSGENSTSTSINTCPPATSLTLRFHDYIKGIKKAKHILGEELQNIGLRDCTILQGTLKNCKLENCIVQSSNLCKLRSTKICLSDAKDCEFLGCQIQNTDAKLSAILGGCLQKCRLASVDISGSILMECKMSETLKTVSNVDLLLYEKLAAEVRLMILRYAIHSRGKTPALIVALRGNQKLYSEALELLNSTCTFETPQGKCNLNDSTVVFDISKTAFSKVQKFFCRPSYPPEPSSLLITDSPTHSPAHAQLIHHAMEGNLAHIKSLTIKAACWDLGWFVFCDKIWRCLDNLPSLERFSIILSCSNFGCSAVMSLAERINEATGVTGVPGNQRHVKLDSAKARRCNFYHLIVRNEPTYFTRTWEAPKVQKLDFNHWMKE
ncbi:hypothetical protein G7Y89_g12068 [Cudoniella acicularis]|uniref:Uncharacterized protein n=1 Tax=Cudoniella acicularis TaxID=354080 RepID=A0A8H4RAS6_9HELO|nr:hypothetical protein G7Y89_g12068 [Cudoniella acicularis]